MAQSFEDWLDEIEAFSTRRERAMDELGPRYGAWLRAAWVGGMEQVEASDTYRSGAALDRKEG